MSAATTGGGGRPRSVGSISASLDVTGALDLGSDADDPCERCGHRWHGLACQRSGCLCPTSFATP